MHLLPARLPTAALWTSLLLGATLGANADEYGSRHPDAPPELLQFGFLIGPWDCEVDWLRQDGTRARGKATWTGRWMMDGWAIQDDWRDGFYEGYRASTFRSWDSREKGWRGYWLDGRSGRWSRPLAQEASGQGLRLRTSTSYRDAEGKKVEVELRYHFHEIADREFSWRQDSSLDGGETWRQGTTRIECARPASWTRTVEWSRPGAAPAAAVQVDDSGLAADGYDVVAYHLEGKARPGSPEHELEHAGGRYRFASADHLRRFREDPESFLPAYGGWCAYCFSPDPAASGGWKPGPYPVDPESFLIEDGRLFLFYREPDFDARAAWSADTEGARQRADRNWAARAAGS